MKRILVVAVVLVGLSACSQYTCPTYAESDVKKPVETEEKSREV